jgi:transcriptional regulator with XRE-family HTH domain
VLLAFSETPVDLHRRREYYAAGMEAGERALGQDFERYRGQFWGHVETRPYMRATVGYANTCLDLGKTSEAMHAYQRMLWLNPDDNQGIRDRLFYLLIERNRDAAATKLLRRYTGPGLVDDVWFAYGRALLAYRRAGDTPAAGAALAAALDANRYAADHLRGLLHPPTDDPPAYSRGDDREGIFFARDAVRAWRATPGALDWLERRVAQEGFGPDDRYSDITKARLPNRIHARRTELGLTREDVAAVLRIAPQIVEHWEWGRHDPRHGIGYPDILAVLGASERDLFPDAETHAASCRTRCFRLQGCDQQAVERAWTEARADLPDDVLLPPGAWAWDETPPRAVLRPAARPPRRGRKGTR